MTTTSISNSDDVIDSRDIIERIEELQALRNSWTCPVCGMEIFGTTEDDSQEGHNPDCDYYGPALDNLDDEREELAALLALQDDCIGVSDWIYGATLIRDGYFEEYAEDLARDLGYLDKATDWPFRHIDWKAAADELKNDYTYVNFGNETYWVR
jgi:hypothetical protein